MDATGVHLLTPVLNMHRNYGDGEQAMVAMALSMGFDIQAAHDAYAFACGRQEEYERVLLELGRNALEMLDACPESFGVVLVGRPYNALASEGNRGIPGKFASRGIMAIPLDMIDASGYSAHERMFGVWGRR